MSDARDGSMESPLRELRERKGLSQADVARHLGVSRQAVNMWESGTNNPSRRLQSALRDLLCDDEPGTGDIREVISLLREIRDLLRNGQRGGGQQANEPLPRSAAEVISQREIDPRWAGVR